MQSMVENVLMKTVYLKQLRVSITLCVPGSPHLKDFWIQLQPFTDFRKVLQRCKILPTVHLLEKLGPSL